MLNNNEKFKIIYYLFLIIFCNLLIDNNLKYRNTEGFSVKKTAQKVGKSAKKVAGKAGDAIMNVVGVVTKPLEIVIKQIFKLIPIKPISKYLKDETKGSKNFFDLIIKLVFAGFKIVLLLGVLPWILVAICSAGSIAGMSMVAKSMFSFIKYMFMGSASDIQSNLMEQQNISNQKIAELENKINQLQS